METVHTQYFLTKLRKILVPAFILWLLSVSILHPEFRANATIEDGPGNAIAWTNSNYVNISNSGSYQVDFTLSGTLDMGDTVQVVVMDGSWNTATGSFLSLSGWESSGSVNLDLSSSGWLEGMLSFDAIVYSGSISTQVVASGMTFTGTLDATAPGITLSSTAPATISWAITVNIMTSESLTGFSSGDIMVTNGTASGFTQTSATGYTMVVTPTMSGSLVISVAGSIASDTAGNQNIVSNTLTYLTSDTTDPILTITSYMSGDTVTWSPVLTWTVTDTGGVANVTVNGSVATLGSGTWSYTLSSLTAGWNTITVMATDNYGNTGSTTIMLNRVSLTSNAIASLSGTSSAVITFNTDLTATGVVMYGTSSGSLGTTLTGSTSGTSHTFTLTGLSLNTAYYFAVQWQGGTQSSIMQFMTPMVVTSSSSWSITATGAIYLSGSTSTGITFTNTGSITVMSVSSNGSMISFPINWLTITASGGGWNGIIQAPEMTSSMPGLSLSGYAFIGNAFQIGNPMTELIFSGQTITVTLDVGASYNGQTLLVYRSTNQGSTYSQLTTCLVAWGNCTFTTNQLSLFALAAPSDTLPNAFSFTGVTGAAISTMYTSTPVVLSWFSSGTIISVTGGGEYSINGGAFTTASGTVNPGDSVTIRGTSSALYSTTVNPTLTVWSSSAAFPITTAAQVGWGGGGGGGGGWGGGGGGGIIITTGTGGGSTWNTNTDLCPNGDQSPTRYDGVCGAYSTGGNIIGGVLGASFNIPPVSVALEDIKFRDIAGTWAHSYINRLVMRGIIDNTTYYRPNDNLTRAEFLKIVLNTTGWSLVYTGATQMSFRDVTVEEWYHDYAQIAVDKHMINDANYFRPNDAITRAEATKIVTKVILVLVNDITVSSFVDVPLSHTLAKYIEAAAFLNIVNGQTRADGTRYFRPNDPITRAEIAKVVVRTFGL